MSDADGMGTGAIEGKIFLTGATGVLGFQVLDALLRDSACEIVLLLRAGSPVHLRERFEKLKADLEELSHGSRDFSRLSAMSGDVSAERFGLTAAQWEELHSLTGIIHAASDVSLDLTEAEAEAVITRPCRELLLLQNSIRERGGKCRLDYVSTVGVIGKSRYPLHEEIVLEIRSFNNNYERYKAQAEEILNENLSAPGEVTIHRPSMIVGDSSTGRVRRFQVFYFLLSVLSGRRFFGFVPDLLHYKMDTIPVDIVALGIAKAALTGEKSFVLNHCSGPSDSLTLRDLRESLEREGHAKPIRLIALGKVRWIFRLIEAMLGTWNPGMGRRFGVYGSILSYCDAEPRFENVKTKLFYLKNKIQFVTPRESIGPVIRYYSRSKNKF